MLTNEAVNADGHTHLTLRVPSEHCAPGLEILIRITGMGIWIGDGFMDWSYIDKARTEATPGHEGHEHDTKEHH